MGDKNISSRRAYSFLMRLMLAVLLLSAFAYVQAKEKVSPETRAKIDKIYSYNFTDLQKSLSLLRQLESAGQIEPYSSNEIRGDLYYNRGNFFESLKYYKRGLYDERASGDIAFQQKVIGPQSRRDEPLCDDAQEADSRQQHPLHAVGSGL